MSSLAASAHTVDEALRVSEILEKHNPGDVTTLSYNNREVLCDAGHCRDVGDVGSADAVTAKSAPTTLTTYDRTNAGVWKAGNKEYIVRNPGEKWDDKWAGEVKGVLDKGGSNVYAAARGKSVGELYKGLNDKTPQQLCIESPGDPVFSTPVEAGPTLHGHAIPAEAGGDVAGIARVCGQWASDSGATGFALGSSGGDTSGSSLDCYRLIKGGDIADMDETDTLIEDVTGGDWLIPVGSADDANGVMLGWNGRPHYVDADGYPANGYPANGQADPVGKGCSSFWGGLPTAVETTSATPGGDNCPESVANEIREEIKLLGGASGEQTGGGGMDRSMTVDNCLGTRGITLAPVDKPAAVAERTLNTIMTSGAAKADLLREKYGYRGDSSSADDAADARQAEMVDVVTNAFGSQSEDVEGAMKVVADAEQVWMKGGGTSMVPGYGPVDGALNLPGVTDLADKEGHTYTKSDWGWSNPPQTYTSKDGPLGATLGAGLGQLSDALNKLETSGWTASSAEDLDTALAACGATNEERAPLRDAITSVEEVQNTLLQAALPNVGACSARDWAVLRDCGDSDLLGSCLENLSGVSESGKQFVGLHPTDDISTVRGACDTVTAYTKWFGQEGCKPGEFAACTKTFEVRVPSALTGLLSDGILLKVKVTGTAKKVEVKVTPGEGVLNGLNSLVSTAAEGKMQYATGWGDPDEIIAAAQADCGGNWTVDRVYTGGEPGTIPVNGFNLDKLGCPKYSIKLEAESIMLMEGDTRKDVLSLGDSNVGVLRAENKAYTVPTGADRGVWKEGRMLGVGGCADPIYAAGAPGTAMYALVVKDDDDGKPQLYIRTWKLRCREYSRDGAMPALIGKENSDVAGAHYFPTRSEPISSVKDYATVRPVLIDGWGKAWRAAEPSVDNPTPERRGKYLNNYQSYGAPGDKLEVTEWKEAHEAARKNSDIVAIEQRGDEFYSTRSGTPVVDGGTKPYPFGPRVQEPGSKIRVYAKPYETDPSCHGIAWQRTDRLDPAFVQSEGRTPSAGDARCGVSSVVHLEGVEGFGNYEGFDDYASCEGEDRPTQDKCDQLLGSKGDGYSIADGMAYTECMHAVERCEIEDYGKTVLANTEALGAEIVKRKGELHGVADDVRTDKGATVAAKQRLATARAMMETSDMRMTVNDYQQGLWLLVGLATAGAAIKYSSSSG